MKFLFLFLISLNLSATEISCFVEKNLSPVLEFTEEVAVGERISIGEIDQFKFYLKSLNYNQFEIEIYDRETPSRQYTEGSGENLKWTLWSREVLLNINCKSL